MKLRKGLFWATAIVLLLGVTGLFAAPAQRPHHLVINEFVASNTSGLVDEEGESADWIELHNQGRNALNLAGWSLSDDFNNPEKWLFPDITLEAGAYLVVFASGKDRKPAGADQFLHTNFRLDKNGGFLGLYNIFDERWVDALTPSYPEQWPDIAYGRSGEETDYLYLKRPTPGKPNDQTITWDSMVEKVDFGEKQRGFYEAPFTVELTNATPGATIFYTIDGSEPTKQNGLKYERPLEIQRTTTLRAVAVKPGLLASAIETHTYIFLDDVLRQTKPPGFPLFDYEMDPDVVNDPRYRQTIKEDLKSIPTLSIVTAVENFDIYMNPRERGPAWERPVSVELIDPQGKGFQTNAGLRIQGGWGRWEVMPKHSFRLFFKGKYGATKLEYPLFPDSPVETFDTLILRGGVNRSYAGKTSGFVVDHHLATYSEDEWLRSSQIEMSGVGSHGIFVHLYINGLYWGLYNVVERPDASFTSAYLGGSRAEWAAMNHSGLISGPDRLETLIHHLANLADLPAADRYTAVESYLDLDNFIDYLILNFYAGNRDWSDSNWYAGLDPRQGKVKFFVWDGELTWINRAKISLLEETSSDRINLFTQAFLALIENEDFRLAFADRLYKHLFNDGALTDARSQARWLEINQTIERAIVAESARWGDTRFDQPITQADWLVARDQVSAQMEGNADRLIHLLRERDYYPPIDPPRFSRPGGLVAADSELVMTHLQVGTIYYTLDGSDPRVRGSGAVASGASIYEAPLTLTTTTQIKARLRAGGAWSALSETTFTVVDQEPQLRVTEIMYNPLRGNDYEFIELKNEGDTPIELANLAFEGINFTFPPSTPALPPNQFIVLANNASAFIERYPDIAIGGVYTGRLSNTGERLALKDGQGNLLLTLTYDDENGWPITPDGRGDSLTLVAPAADPNNPESWRASAELYGSPGKDEPPRE
jgi:hypothetical protein